MALSKIMYTAKVTAKGGREGEVVSDDGLLRVKLSAPKETGGAATNPEQLFAGGYAACFLSAFNLVANKKKIAVSEDATVTAEVSLGPLGEGFGLAVRLLVSAPGMAAEQIKELADAAHKICPYSNATRNNVDVEIVAAGA